jgi:hypothetical protein
MDKSEKSDQSVSIGKVAMRELFMSVFIEMVHNAIGENPLEQPGHSKQETDTTIRVHA